MAEDVIDNAAPDTSADTAGQQDSGDTLLTSPDEPAGDTLLTSPEDEGEEGAEPECDKGEEKEPEKAKEPEDYKLTVPEGMDEKLAAQIEQGCKDFGLTKENADRYAKMVQEQQEKNALNFKQERAGWVDSLKNDPEFGGEKFKATCTNAKRALRAFDPDKELWSLLQKTGYGDHSAVFKFFARAGAVLREDKVIHGAGGDKRPLEDRLYKQNTF